MYYWLSYCSVIIESFSLLTIIISSVVFGYGINMFMDLYIYNFKRTPIRTLVKLTGALTQEEIVVKH